MTTAVRQAARLGQALTDRELQVVRGAANGRSNAQIGAELFLAENTVKSHLHRAARKLGATGRAHTVALALQQGALTLWDIQPTLGPRRTTQGPSRAVQRVRGLLADWRHAKPPQPHLIGHWWEHRLTQLATAVGDDQAPTP